MHPSDIRRDGNVPSIAGPSASHASQPAARENQPGQLSLERQEPPPLPSTPIPLFAHDAPNPVVAPELPQSLPPMLPRTHLARYIETSHEARERAANTISAQYDMWIAGKKHGDIDAAAELTLLSEIMEKHHANFGGNESPLSGKLLDVCKRILELVVEQNAQPGSYKKPPRLTIDGPSLRVNLKSTKLTPLGKSKVLAILVTIKVLTGNEHVKVTVSPDNALLRPKSFSGLHDFEIDALAGQLWGQEFVELEAVRLKRAAGISSEFLTQQMGLPQSSSALTGIVAGYLDGEPEPTSRKAAVQYARAMTLIFFDEATRGRPPAQLKLRAETIVAAYVDVRNKCTETEWQQCSAELVAIADQLVAPERPLDGKDFGDLMWLLGKLDKKSADKLRWVNSSEVQRGLLTGEIPIQ